MHSKSTKIILVFIILVLNVLSSPLYENFDNLSISLDTIKTLNADENSINNEINSSIDTSSKSESEEEVLLSDIAEIIDPEKKNTDIPSFNWAMTSEEINSMCNDINNTFTTSFEKLLLIPDEDCSFESIIAPFFYMRNELSNTLTFLRFGLKLYGTNAASKNDINNCEILIMTLKNNSFNQMIPKFKKVFENINTGKFNNPEDPNDIKLLDIISSSLKKYNDKYNEYDIELKTIIDDFMFCVMNDNTTIIFTKNELYGVPEIILSDFEKTIKDGEEAYVINLSNPNSYSVSEYAVNENTRKIYRYISNRICESNLEKLKLLNHQVMKLIVIM